MKVFWLAVAALAAQPGPTFRVPVHLVNVPALVFSKENGLVTGLQATDFRVYDNGHLQKVSLDTAATSVSVVLAVQVSQDVRGYVPFIKKAGSVVEALLVGDAGEAAVIAYNGDITVLKPFDTGDVQMALSKVSTSGTTSRMIDAGHRAITLLKERPAPRTRILLFIGQPMDSGSETTLGFLRERAERENVSIYTLTLPELGKAFVSDTFSLQGLPREGGGFKAGADLRKLIAVLNRSSAVEKGADPFSVLTAATGGTQLHFRRQKELESAIATIGVELRSAYLLSYSPRSTETGYHTIQVEVNVPGATVHSRPGYWLGAN
jgi:VWFA-related protein